MNINYKKMLPSKAVTAFLVIPLIGIIVFFSIKNTIQTPEERALADTKDFRAALLEQSQEQDTDGDGLYDWQEVMYGTDKNKKDTDGDGAFDGLEVKVGTDPTDPLNKKTADREKIEKIILEEEYENNPNLSRTDIITREFLLKVADLKGANLMGNASTQGFVVDELIDENSFSFKKKYSKKDLNITTISKDRFKREFRARVQNSGIVQTQDNFYLLATYLEKKDKRVLQEIKENLVIYKKFEQDSLTQKINEEDALVYLEYMNVLAEYITSIEMIAEVDNDTVTALYGFRNYKDIYRKMNSVANVLSLYFK